MALTPAAKELAEIVKENKDRSEIILFGKSLGGVVAEKAIRFSDFQKNISRLVYVVTPHRSKNVDIPNTIKIINIYSHEDNYLRFANIVLYQHFRKNDLENAENIVIPNIRHSAFNTNNLIEYNKREIQLFDLYMKLLLPR